MTVASLSPELQSALEQCSDQKRCEALRRITSLFVEGAGRFNDDHLRLFDDVFVLLMAEVDSKARQELSRRLAPIVNCPIQTTRRLAEDDDILVAAPLLVQSSRLATADLVEIASSKSAEHLYAIAGRPNIDIDVTEILVARGDLTVKRKLAGNGAARISESGFTTLILSAGRDRVLAEAVSKRTDIPDHPEIRGQIRTVLAKLSGGAGSAPPASDSSAAREKIKAMADAGEWSEARLAVIAQPDDRDGMVAALSALTSVSAEVIERLMIGERPDPVLILCRAAGYSWPAARDIILARTGARGKATIAIEAVHATFDRLSESTAKRVVRFWQMSPGSLKATG